MELSDDRSPSKKVLWRCKCKCGNEKQLQPAVLLSGKSKSCGCIKREMAEKRVCVYCTKPEQSLGLCQMHYYRWRRKQPMEADVRGSRPLAWACPHAKAKHAARGMCNSCYQKVLNSERSPEERKQKSEYLRQYVLETNFGMTIAEYDAMLDVQGGGCKICTLPCRTGNRLAVDHDHATGIVRGLLCYTCNTKLGWYEKFRDAVDVYLAPHDTL